MSAPFQPPQLEDDPLDPPEHESGNPVGSEIMSELVKSYGFKRDRTSGDWSWSTENIAQAFRDNPFWASIDYLTLSVPPARWGLAAGKIAAGVGQVGKAYQAGALGTQGFRGAMKLQKIAPPTTRMGRAFSSTGTARYTDDSLQPTWEYASAIEKRGLADVAKRELFIERNVVTRMRNEALRATSAYERSIGDEAASFTRLLETSPLDEADEWGRLWGTLNAQGRKAYHQTFRFREYLHEEAYKAGLISEKVYLKNLQTYVPRAYRKWIDSEEAAALGIRGAGRPSAERGTRHFRPRTLAKSESYAPELERILDPKFAIVEMGDAGFVVANQKYALMLGDTPLVSDVDPGDWKRLRDLFPGEAGGRVSKRMREMQTRRKRHVAALKRMGKDKERIVGTMEKRAHMVDRFQLRAGMRVIDREGEARQLGRGARATRRSIPQARDKQRFADLGEEHGRWAGQRTSKRGKRSPLEVARETIDARRSQEWAKVKRLDEAIKNQAARESAPGMLRNVPDELWEKYVDPIALDAFTGAAEIGELNIFQKLYRGTLGFFKAGHTAYNPATHSRNFLGNVMFYSMAMGLSGAAKVALRGGPRRGIKAYLSKSDDFYEAVRAGVVGGAYDSEISKTVRGVYELKGKAHQATGADWIAHMLEGRGMQRAGGFIRRSAAKAERLYGAEDEVWKLEAFINRKRDLLKLGASKDEAINLAQLEVARFFPNYQTVSPVTDMLRGHLPFVSFPAEAARSWKNAMTHRPWVALWWNHMAESASSVFAATSGISEDEMEAARQSLPWYTAEKKMLLLPWRDTDGKPHFLDLSYIIPMADMGAEAQMQENTFLGIPLASPISPTSNPVLQTIAGAVTGVDPFSDRPIEPRFTEQQLGIPVEQEGTRRAVGLAEHIARTMLPPLVPPGYVGVNLLELARGSKSGVTGQPLEEGLTRTLLTNLAGLRTYEPTVKAQLSNIRREQRQVSEKVSDMWDRWELAVANGDMESAEFARNAIIQAKGAQWFSKRMDSHVPGSYGNVGTAQLLEVIRRAQRFEASPSELGPLYHAYLTRSSR